MTPVPSLSPCQAGGVSLSPGSPGIAMGASGAMQLCLHKWRRVDVSVTALCDCRICVFVKRGDILGTLNIFLT